VDLSYEGVRSFLLGEDPPIEGLIIEFQVWDILESKGRLF
jgi:hypothetical protein